MKWRRGSSWVFKKNRRGGSRVKINMLSCPAAPPFLFCVGVSRGRRSRLWCSLGGRSGDIYVTMSQNKMCLQTNSSITSTEDAERHLHLDVCILCLLFLNHVSCLFVQSFFMWKGIWIKTFFLQARLIAKKDIRQV